MFSTKIKKLLVSLIVTATLIMSAGVAGMSTASAQYRGRGWAWTQRNRELRYLQMIRRLDRDRQLRYQTRGYVRTVGYYDRFGRFHAYGFYDRFGRFHRFH